MRRRLDNCDVSLAGAGGRVSDTDLEFATDTGKDAVSARQLSLETGLRQQTLSRWLQDASSLSVMPSKRQTKEWSIDEKIRVLAKAGKLTGAELADLLEREGLMLADYEQWRLALAEEGRASLATTKRIRTLERELTRKEKALAEAAALLVLKKKVNRLWDDEGADTDEENDQ
jgi:transposase